jgi:hypothetical protein
MGHHEEKANFNELCASLDCRGCVEMQSTESWFEVEFWSKYLDIGEFVSSGDLPVDNLHDASSEHAREKLVGLSLIVDWSAWGPLEALVMGQAVLFNNLPMLINHVLFLDVHQGK